MISLIFHVIGGIEIGACFYFIYIIISKRHRLTLKIEIALAFITAGSNLFSEFFVDNSVSYSFLLILLGFSLNVILLISFAIRSKLTRIPDPPLVCFNSSFIYEHKLLYQHIYEFLQGLSDKELLSSLELGIYINMYKTEKKEAFLIQIKKLCKQCELPQYSYECAGEIEEYISKNNEYIFQYFCKSGYYYERFKRSLKNNRNILLSQLKI